MPIGELAEDTGTLVIKYELGRAFIKYFGITPHEGLVEPPKDVKLSDLVLGILTSREFCYKKPEESLRQGLTRKLEEVFNRHEPIYLNVLFGPRKNPNTCDVNLTDWSEELAITQLIRLQYEVGLIYKPGLQIILFCDDARAIVVNDYSTKSTQEYIESLRERCRLNSPPLGHHVEVVSFNQIYEEFRVLDRLSAAKKRVLEWEADPQNKETIKIMNLHCEKNRAWSLVDSAERVSEVTKASSHLYRVYFEAERLAGVYDIPDIWATYRGEPGFLHVYSLAKGVIAQPWQGEGCLLVRESPDEDDKIVPCVLTGERSSKLNVILGVDFPFLKLAHARYPEYPRKIKLVV